MADLKTFQARLNSDKAFRADFFKDPVKSLEAAGLILPEAAKKRLVEHVGQLSAKQRPPEKGPDIEVMIKP